MERSAPFHPGPPSYRAGTGTAEVTVQAVGPGLFPGETLVIEVHVEAGADLVVHGQGATKVYPSPTGVPARTRTRLRVEGGGRLTWLPGELIPFRRAVLEQATEFELAADARLALAERLTPGRVAMGEREAYDRLDLRLHGRVEGRLVVVERARLEPAVRPLVALGRHGGFACAGTLYLVGFGDTAALGQGARDDEVWWGSGRSLSADLTIVRLLGRTAQAVRGRIDALLPLAAAPVGAPIPSADPGLALAP